MQRRTDDIERILQQIYGLGEGEGDPCTMQKCQFLKKLQALRQQLTKIFRESQQQQQYQHQHQQQHQQQPLAKQEASPQQRESKVEDQQPGKNMETPRFEEKLKMLQQQKLRQKKPQSTSCTDNGKPKPRK